MWQVSVKLRQEAFRFPLDLLTEMVLAEFEVTMARLYSQVREELGFDHE